MNQLLGASFVLLLAVPASAVEWHVMGPRALGMGGAGVATAQGPLAAYWNPAALGRKVGNAYGLQVPFGVHYGITGSIVEGANDLRALRDKGASTTQADVDAAVAKLAQTGGGLRIDGGFAIASKIKDFSVFLNGFVFAGAMPFIDQPVTAAAVIAGTNNSKLIVKGASVSELGVGYGHELPFAPGLSAGGALKLMNASVGYVDYFVLRENNEQGNILGKLKDGARKSSNFGVDAGLLWDLDKSFDGVALKPRVGLVGRNLNNPSFKQPAAAETAGYSRFKLNPQVRLGFSLQPLNWWNLAADVDLTRNLTPVDNVASRQLGVGSEFNVFNRSWINIPLRVGLSKNLAESSAGTMLSLGSGLHFLHVFVDASAAISSKRIQTQSEGKSEKAPREASLGLQLSVLFGGVEPEAPAREWKTPPPTDDQPVSADKVREASEKAQKELDAEAAKKAPVYSPR